MRNISMREAINEAMHIALASDEKIITFGEDIAVYGGQLRCSYGLLDEFGPERVRDTPISEIAIIGAGVGAALTGYRPIVELSYIDFIGCCFDQIMNQAAKLRYMNGGQVSVPMVIRTEGGAALGNAAQHSQSLEALLAHVPGIRVIIPSNAYDAKGLLLRAIRDNNPCVFIEHKALYKQKCDVPEEPYEVDYGCKLKREGKDITIVSYSAMTPKALKAAEILAGHGIEAEVVDVLTLEPFIPDEIIKSVKKTGHVLVTHEAVEKGGFGGEIITKIQELAFNELKAPAIRVCAPNTPVPFAPILEDTFVPMTEDVIAGVCKCLGIDPIE